MEGVEVDFVRGGWEGRVDAPPAAAAAAPGDAAAGEVTGDPRAGGGWSPCGGDAAVAGEGVQGEPGDGDACY